MADRWPIPEGIKPEAVAVVTGLVAKQAVTTWLPAEKTEYCEVELQVGNWDCILRAYGKVAERFATILAGAPVRVTASVEQRITKLPGGITKVATEVHVIGVEELNP